jgi:hypothetical protein
MLQLSSNDFLKLAAIAVLTVGILAGVRIIYLLPPFVILLAAVDIWAGWKTSQEEGGPEPKRPAYWLGLAFVYAGVAAVAVVLAWIYLA